MSRNGPGVSGISPPHGRAQARGIGLSVPDQCRELGISTATSFYKWRSKFGGMHVSLIARMKELEAENAWLRGQPSELGLRAVESKVSSSSTSNAHTL